MVFTSASGFMSSRRSLMTSAFGMPTVEVSAHSWRFMLLSPTVSWSISVRCPTPLRASASAHHEPTPPSPNTATCAFLSFSIASAPRSISARMVLSFIIISPSEKAVPFGTAFLNHNLSESDIAGRSVVRALVSFDDAAENMGSFHSLSTSCLSRFSAT